MDLLKRVAGYVRVSSGIQAKKGESLSEQKRMIEEYSKFHNYSITKIYVDPGISGLISNRASLDDLKRDADQGLFQKVIFYSLDRLGRNAQDLLNNYDYFEKRRIDLVSLKESIDTSTPTGRFLRTVLGGVAEFVGEVIRRNTVMGMAARMKRGLRPVGRLPYGYGWDKRKRTFKIIPAEREGYDLAIHLFLNKRKSLNEVAGILNEKGYRTKQGKRFTHPSLSRIFHSPFYKGEWSFEYQGERFSYNPPPLLDPRTWGNIQERIKENTKQFTKYDPAKDPFLLRGLLQCECGSTLSCTTLNQRYYECSASKITPTELLASNLKRTCSLPYINAREIEKFVLDSILSPFKLYDKNTTNPKEDIYFDRKEYLENKLRGIQIAIKERDTQKKRAGTSNTISCEGEASLGKKEWELRKETAVLMDKSRVIRSELDYIVKSQPDSDPVKNIGKDLKELCPVIHKAFADMTNRQKKEFISEALSGKQLKIRILRKRDLVKSGMGLSKGELNAPVYKIWRGRKRMAWIVEGDWNFNLHTILKNRFPKRQTHFKINNYGIPVPTAPSHALH